MAKNRKANSAAIRFGPAVKAFLLCLVIGGSGIGYVWQKDQIAKLGKQVLERERKLEAVLNQNEQSNTQLGQLKLPHYLEGQIQKQKLGLAPPQLAQVWRMTEPARELVREPARPAAEPMPANSHVLAGP